MNPIPPSYTNTPLAFNLIEIFLLILPFEWWLPTPTYERLNNLLMRIIYSPHLLVTAYLETQQAKSVSANRSLNQADDDTVEEWEQRAGDVDFEGEGWAKKVENSRPNVETDAAVLEIREVREKVAELRSVIEMLAVRGKGDEDSR